MTQEISNSDLFKVFESLIPTDFKSRFNIGKTSVDNCGINKIIPNTITIQIRFAKKPYRLASGEIATRYKRVIFKVYTDIYGQKSMDECEKACEHIANAISGLFGKYVEIKDNNGDTKQVWISDCELVKDPGYIGLNEQGIHWGTIEYIVTY